MRLFGIVAPVVDFFRSPWFEDLIIWPGLVLAAVLAFLGY